MPTPSHQLSASFWSHTIISRYTTVSASVLYFWDFFLTIEDEVEYFWNSRWSFAKFLFFFNRYHRIPTIVVNLFFNLYSHPNKSICFAFAVSGGWISLIGALAIQGILQLRLFALYGQNRMIITIVSALCVVQAISVIAMQAVEWKYAKDQLQKAPALASSSPVCMIPLPDFFYALAIPYIGFDFVLCALAAVRALACYRELSPTQRSWSSFIAVFLRDSILAFVVTFVLNLAVILVWQYAPHDLYAIVIYWPSIIPAIVANRMLINMRKVGREDQKTFSDMHSIATIQFRMSRREGGQWVD